MASNSTVTQREQQKARRALISKTLRTIALEVDPINGYLKSLADDFQVHPMTLSEWIKNGEVPRFQAVRLRKRYGDRLVDVDLISRGE